MKGKKWLSLALAGMLAVSALAGCGSSSSSTGSADTASTSTGSADYDLYIFNKRVLRLRYSPWVPALTVMTHFVPK